MEDVDLDEPLLPNGHLGPYEHLKSRARRRISSIWPFFALATIFWIFYFFRGSAYIEDVSKLRSHFAGIVSGHVNGSHPIPILIRQGQQRWREKLDRQSKDLTAAVLEYQRRYKRPPPRGFDRWFAWADAHHVELKDEFDLIEEHIRPFFALAPDVLRQRIADLPGQLESVSILNVTDGALKHDEKEHKSQIGDIKQKLVDPIAPLLADIALPINTMDHPRMATEWDILAEHLVAVERGETLKDDFLPPLRQVSPTTICPPASRTRQQEPKSFTQTLAFIGSDWRAALDVCDNPVLLSTHARMFKLPDEQASPWCQKRYPTCATFGPLLSYSPISAWGDIGLPTWGAASEGGGFRTGDAIPFEQKRHAKAGWRGIARGTWNQSPTPWQDGQRPRLHMLTHRDVENVTQMAYFADEDGKVVSQQLALRELNERYLDVAVTNHAEQCWACWEIQKWLDATNAPHDDNAGWIYHYQYLIDIDSNGRSEQFRQVMASNACVLKSTIVSEWFRDRIQPWVHFVPLRVDYGDLYDIMTFFAGNATGGYNHTSLAAEIAQNGQEWSKRYYREQDAQAFYRLFLELSRLLSDERNTTIYELPSKQESDSQF